MTAAWGLYMYPILIFSNCFAFFLLKNLICHVCPVLQDVGPFWGRLEETRFCHCSLPGACGLGWLPMSSCTPSALYTSSPAQTETTMSQLYGTTSYQVRMNTHQVVFNESFFLVWFFSVNKSNVTYLLVFWQSKFIISKSRWQTILTAHMTTALLCIMEGMLLFNYRFY